MIRFSYFPDPESEVLVDSRTFVAGDEVTLSFKVSEPMRVVFLKLKGFCVNEKRSNPSKDF